ncbi:hypothetical protein GGI12_003859 [Dipsacomyces acuminosporus]|nr:hypothetical protein GGI12_003859 [Dipsacomyces acuminosporus]
MRYGLFLGLDDSGASGSEGAGNERLKVTLSADSKPNRRKTVSPIKRQQPAVHSNGKSPVGRLLERKRRSASLAEEPKLTGLAGWRLLSKRNLGLPFPNAASSRGSTLAASTNSSRSRASHYREISQKAKAKHRRIDDIEGIRASACESFTKPIHKEMEETRRFLSQLSVSSSPAAQKPLGMDEGVQDALKQLDEMRKDFERKIKEEEEAKLKAIRDAEDEKKRREQEQQQLARKQAQEKEEEEKRRLAQQQQEQQEQQQLQQQQQQQAIGQMAGQGLQASKGAATTAAKSSTQVSAVALEWGEKYRAMYRQLMGELAPKIRANKDTKSYCFMQKGLITRSIGQLKDSQEFVNRISQKIADIIAEASNRYGADAQSWVINLTAKSIVKQAETEVTVHRNVAYPLAAVTVNIMQLYPQLIDLLMVRLVKKCPYVIPQYIGRRPNQTSDEFLRSIGYKEKDDDVLETDVMYEERMNGMLCLFAAVVQTTPLNGKPNPFPVAYGWTWFARMVNLQPRSVSPSLVNSFLEIAGDSMMAAYSKQFKKLLDVLVKQWMPAIPLDEPLAVASKSRLSSYMDKYASSGTLTQIEGRNIKRV